MVQYSLPFCSLVDINEVRVDVVGWLPASGVPRLCESVGMATRADFLPFYAVTCGKLWQAPDSRAGRHFIQNPIHEIVEGVRS